jgi:hypothetical protein
MPAVDAQAEEQKLTAQQERVKKMKEAWPVGQLVELKGGDYPGNQGIVIDIVEKAMVPYVRVRLEVYNTGKRRPEGKQPAYDMRDTSLFQIESYRELPAPPAPKEPTPAAATTEAAAAPDPGNVEAQVAAEVAPAEASTVEETAGAEW